MGLENVMTQFTLIDDVAEEERARFMVESLGAIKPAVIRVECPLDNPGFIDEIWSTIGGGKVHVVIPPEFRRPWQEGAPAYAEHRHPFGMTWPQDSLKDSGRV